MANLTQKTFLGQGIIFPITLNSLGRPDIETGIDLIRSSIKIILNWPYATRFFLNEFGCRIEELLEEPNDSIVKSLVKHFIVDSISNFEKRVELLEVSIVNPTSSSLDIKISYRILSSQQEDSFIFPFYKQIVY
jgi:hypothetical protein